MSTSTPERLTRNVTDGARTVADGLRVRRLGDAPFEHVRAFVDDIVTVTEEEILEAMRRRLRSLVQFIDKRQRRPVYTTIGQLRTTNPDQPCSDRRLGFPHLARSPKCGCGLEMRPVLRRFL